MNPNRSSSFAGRSLGADDDSEVVRVLDAYLSGIEAGQPADPEKLLAEHPALAGPLRAYLKVMNLAGRLAGDSSVGPEALHADPSTVGSTTPTGSTLLSTLDFGPGPLPHIHLHELLDDCEPLVMPRSAEMPNEKGTAIGRYQLQGEIARGGMGAILRGRDVDLGRELAIKVLLESHRGDSDAVRRFVEEAQIGGQLQHPGIVPVYELGTFPDHRPFFAMKLVKGRTLAALLAERRDRSLRGSPGSADRAGRGSPDPADRAGRGSPDPADRAGRGSPDPALPATEGLPPAPDDLPRFLAIFEQICQTMAYAHARGVIHRDLKPSNIMVGSFGEVQVMDWGLAKVLPTGGIADEEAAAQAIVETIITTVRSGSTASGSESQAGSVLGTPSYMAPEQARGEVDRIDERADVFGLGAILCEMLTGRPPFSGSTREDLRAGAARGDMTDALRRLDASAAGAELIDLVRHCLAVEREARPRNAGEVTRRLTAYLLGVQDRLRTAELARFEAQTRAEEAQVRARIERSRRHRTVALAASVVVTAGLVGGGWAFLVRQRLERAAIFNQAVGEAEALYYEAKRVGDDVPRWHTAREAVHAVERFLADAPDERRRSGVTALVAEVAQSAAAAENDQKLLARLVEIRSAHAVEDPDGLSTGEAYDDAFREAGFDMAVLAPAEAAAKIRARPMAVRVSLAAALDDWAALGPTILRDNARALRLTDAAQLADPEPWRNRLRALLRTSSRPKSVAGLKDLARSARAEELPAVSIHLLGASLLAIGDPSTAEGVLRAGQHFYPADVRLNLTLAHCLVRLARREEAIRYYMAARSLRPEAAHDLAHALEAQGDSDQAIALFRDLVRLRPKDGRQLSCLGNLLQDRGRSAEATVVLNAAIAAARTEIGRKPDSAFARAQLGLALSRQGKLPEAVDVYREAVRIKPDYVAHNNLGAALKDLGKLDEAIAELHTALRINPDYCEAHTNLGTALREQGKLVEAIAEFRTAIRIKPDYSQAHTNLGLALRQQGKLDEAIAEFHTALRIKPDSFGDHNNLGVTLLDKGKFDEALAEFREALRIRPHFAEPHNNIGTALRRSGKLDEAIAEYHDALRINPEHLLAHCNLGMALLDQGKLEEATAECRAALRLDRNSPEANGCVGAVLNNQGDFDGAIVALRSALRVKPDDSNSRQVLAAALANQGKLDEAIAEFRESLRFKPDDPLTHKELGTALVGQGKLDEAIAEFRESVRLKPDDPLTHKELGTALVEQSKLDEAIAEFRTSLGLRPDDPDTHYELGIAFRAQGKLEQASAAYRTAIRLKPDCAQAHCNLGLVLIAQGHPVEGLAELKMGHELGSKSPGWRYPSGDWVRSAERLVDLDRRLPAVLGGRDKPADASESRGLAQMCYDKKLYAASSRLWDESFQAQPTLAYDMNVQNRYNAACAAALAGSGQGKDTPPLDDEKKSHWRKQAIDWLEADLAAWSKILASGPPQAKQAIAQTLQHWKADTDLAGLRDAAALAKLSGDEQKACRALWAEVAALLAKAQAPTNNQ